MLSLAFLQKSAGSSLTGEGRVLKNVGGPALCGHICYLVISSCQRFVTHLNQRFAFHLHIFPSHSVFGIDFYGLTSELHPCEAPFQVIYSWARQFSVLMLRRGMCVDGQWFIFLWLPKGLSLMSWTTRYMVQSLSS